MDQLVQQLVNGILIGLVYALLAIGLTLIWGVMNVLNFAHGEFLMIGMFISYWLYVMAGVDPLFSIPINAVALFLMGMFISDSILALEYSSSTSARRTLSFAVFRCARYQKISTLPRRSMPEMSYCIANINRTVFLSPSPNGPHVI